MSDSRCATCGGTYDVRRGWSTYAIVRSRWIKIGRTRCPVETRVRALRRDDPGVVHPPEMRGDPAPPVTLAMLLPYDAEHRLHEFYSAHHIIGEWFHRDPVWLDLFDRGVLAA